MQAWSLAYCLAPTLALLLLSPHCSMPIHLLEVFLDLPITSSRRRHSLPLISTGNILFFFFFGLGHSVLCVTFIPVLSPLLPVVKILVLLSPGTQPKAFLCIEVLNWKLYFFFNFYWSIIGLQCYFLLYSTVNQLMSGSPWPDDGTQNTAGRNIMNNVLRDQPSPAPTAVWISCLNHSFFFFKILSPI